MEEDQRLREGVGLGFLSVDGGLRVDDGRLRFSESGLAELVVVCAGFLGCGEKLSVPCTSASFEPVNVGVMLGLDGLFIFGRDIFVMEIS